MLCLLHFFFFLIYQLILPVTNHYELKIDWGKSIRTHLFLWTCIFPGTLQYVIKSSLQRDENNQWQIWLQSTCISSMTCMQNWELLVFYPWRQRHLGDVKMKCGETKVVWEKRCNNNQLLKQRVDYGGQKHHILLRKESSLFKGK